MDRLRGLREGARMTVGTRSVLYGAHCFFVHPWFVARAWWKLYGFPWDPRLWAAFFLHDIGYIGKPNMDGPEGEYHPVRGAKIMTFLFDLPMMGGGRRIPIPLEGKTVPLGLWGRFTLLHSRYLAKMLGRPPSKLCMADKLAIALTPAWLYLPMVNWTGEIHEYMARARTSHSFVSEDERQRLISGNQAAWYSGVQSYMIRWVEEHKDGKDDNWTDPARHRETDDGVWR